MKWSAVLFPEGPYVRACLSKLILIAISGAQGVRRTQVVVRVEEN